MGGLEKVIPIWQELHAAFSIYLQVESIIAEGEIVAARYIEHGKSVGPFRGQPLANHMKSLLWSGLS